MSFRSAITACTSSTRGVEDTNPVCCGGVDGGSGGDRRTRRQRSNDIPPARQLQHRRHDRHQHRHRRGPASTPPRSSAATLLISVLLALFTFFITTTTTAAAAAAAASTARQRQQHRHLQQGGTTTTPACATPLPNGGIHSVSLPADAADLATALSACTGGAYNVTWTGAVVLESPLVVAAGSSLTITGAPAAGGVAAALDGGGAIGLLDLGAGSSLRLEGVILRNARRGDGRGAAVRAEGAGCSVVAVNSTFLGNEAFSTSTPDNGRGGALSLAGGATAELEDCVVSGNSALNYGGGVYSDGGEGSVMLTRCVIKDNASSWRGGGVGVIGSSVVLDGCTVSGNSAAEEGGGLYGLNATVAVVGQSEFVNNTFVGSGGGGISMQDESNLTIADSAFRRNWWTPNTTFDMGSGGAVRVHGGYFNTVVSINDSLFEENYAEWGGGLWIVFGYSLSVTGTVFRDNLVARFGGAVSVGSGGVAEFTACSFTGNSAHNGAGGMIAEGCRLSISDSHFEGNNNRFSGGAFIAEENAVVTMEGSTFVNNYIDIQGPGPGSGGAVVVSGSTLNATDCIFENNQADFPDAGDDYDPSTEDVEGGGAVMLEASANASFVDCNFTLNGGALGGAILARVASAAVLTGVLVTSNEASLFGGGLSFNDGSSCLVTDSYVTGNTAGAGGGGGLHFNGGTGLLDGVTLTGNSVSAGSGGALYFASASNVTVAGGRLASNTASGSGGHVLATNPGTNVELLPSLPTTSATAASSSGADPQAVTAEEDEGQAPSPAALAPTQPLALQDGEAGAHGGAVHASDGAAVTVSSVELSGNRADEDGGAVSAFGARLFEAVACNVTANICGGNGGGVSVTGAAFVGTRSNFTGNKAGADGGGLRASTGGVVELEGCRFEGNAAELGGGVSSVDATLTARTCQVTDNRADRDGGGLRLSYQTIAVLDACEVSFNTAELDGGGVAVDAAAGTTDDSLFLSNASSTLTCRGGGTFEGNLAGERGGAMYVTRGSTVTFDACGSLSNSASVGAAVYAAHSFVALMGGSMLAYDEVPTGALIYALSTQVEAHNATFWAAEGSPNMLAVQMTDGSSMKALASSFRGWHGSYVVLTGGELEMDACDFRGSLANVLVSANHSTPAIIRNTAVGIESYSSLASSDAGATDTDTDTDTTLSENVMTCASDPCGGSGGEEEDGGFGCVDGNLGVYCPCFVATVTAEELCLGEMTTLQLESPTEQLVTLGTQGTIESTLNITAGTEGGAVVWEVEEVTRSFSEEGLVWTIVPNVGILEPGASATVSITGNLNATISGPTAAQFKAESLQSGRFALAIVNTTFYYCEEGEYYHGNDHDLSTADDDGSGDGLCLKCTDLDLGDEGLECDTPGVLLTTLPLASGHWRASNETTTIRKCLNEDACEGGSVIHRSDDYCAVGYGGPYCAVCSSGFAGGIANGCHECSEAFRAGMYFLAAVAAALSLVGLWFLFRYLVQPPSGTRSFNLCRNNRIVSKARQLPVHKLKIPIVVFQILTQYADITTVEFPPAFSKFLSALDAVNLDVGWMLSASCIFTPSFYGRLLLTTLGPIVLGLGLACTFFVARRRVMRAGLPKANGVTGMRSVSSGTGITGISETRQLSVVKTRHMTVLVTGTFLVYSTVSTIVFQTFACDTLDELDKSFLRADYSLVCDTDEHNKYKIYAGVMILVYPIGIPLLYAWQLFKHRHRIYPKQALRDGVSPERRLGDKKIAHTVVLWEAYRPCRYYYEVIECARRLLLTGCLVFILPNSAGQAGVACVLAVVTVCVFINLRPFYDNNDDRLYVLGCAIIFLSMFVSLVPKVEIAEGDHQSQTVVSWLLIALGVTLWVMAIVQCFWEVRVIGRDAGGRLDSGSSAANLMGPDGLSRRGTDGEDKSDGTSSGYKNFSPEDRNTDNPSSSDLYDFAHGNGNSGGSSGGGDGDRKHNGGGGVKGGATLGSGGSRAEYHSSVAAAAGQLQYMSSSPAGSNARGASGYADPVVLEFNNGMNVSGGGGSGGGGGGGNEAAMQAFAAGGNQSQSSGNTYGPLASVEDGRGDGEAADGSSYSYNNNNNNDTSFPAINYADDGGADSPTLAEEMFSRRLEGGSGGCGGGGPQGGAGGGGRGSASMYSDSDSTTMAEEMFSRRLGGSGGTGGGSSSGGSKGGRPPGATATGVRGGGSDLDLAGHATAIYSGVDEHGGEEGSGSKGPLRLSPSGPLANAFPAPMTNAFPASTDTPESEFPGGGGGVGGGGKKQGGSSGPLSPSPASSLALLGPSPSSQTRDDAAPGAAPRGSSGGFGLRRIGSKWGGLGSGGDTGSGSNR
eukprot:g8654.t1